MPLHDDECDCVRCRGQWADDEESCFAVGCGVPVGGPRDRGGLCDDCAGRVEDDERAMRAVEG